MKSAAIITTNGGFRTLAAVLDEAEAITANFNAGYKELVTTIRPYETATTYLASFKHPKAETVNTHFKTVSDLLLKVGSLENIYSLLISEFADWRQTETIARRMETLILRCRAKVDRALQLLAACYDKHLPDYFAKCSKSIFSRLSALFEPVCSGCETFSLVRVIVRGGEAKGTQFATYLRIHDVKDQSGHVHGQYHVVLACTVDLYGRYRMSFGLQPEILLPGTFRLTDTFSSPRDGLSLACTRLSEEGLLGVSHAESL